MMPSLTNAMMWVTCSPITDKLEEVTLIIVFNNKLSRRMIFQSF